MVFICRRKERETNGNGWNQTENKLEMGLQHKRLHPEKKKKTTTPNWHNTLSLSHIPYTLTHTHAQARAHRGMAEQETRGSTGTGTAHAAGGKAGISSSSKGLRPSCFFGMAREGWMAADPVRLPSASAVSPPPLLLSSWMDCALMGYWRLGCRPVPCGGAVVWAPGMGAGLL